LPVVLKLSVPGATPKVGALGPVNAAGDRRILAAEDAAEIGCDRTWRPNVSKR
jgi:hypothetical protein